jgi:GTP-binding protein
MAQRLAARFIISAARPDQFPAESLLPGSPAAQPEKGEVAFLGRSNVGKSSLLNALVDQFGATGNGKKLAFTSQRPGCTQVINFFEMGDDLVLVDLPGYGYAKVPVEIQKSWKQLIESYLVNRVSLRLCVLLLDARRGWMDKDLELKQWLESRDRRYLVAATKSDKLTQRELQESVTAIRAQAEGVEIMPISAINGRGVRELWQTIWKIHNQ